MPKADVIRFQIELDRAQMEDLDRLAMEAGLRTKKELLNNALTLLKWAARQKAAGHSILSLSHPGNVLRELEMPFLESIAATARQRARRDEPDDTEEKAQPVARTRSVVRK